MTVKITFYRKEARLIARANLSPTLEVWGFLLIYNEYSKKIVEHNLDLPNSNSLVFRITGNEQSMLFFADFEDADLADELYTKYGHELDSNYIQR